MKKRPTDFLYTEEEAQRILKALGNPQRGAAVLAAIENVVRWYLLRRDMHEWSKSRADKVTAQLKRLEASIADFLECLGAVDLPVSDAMDFTAAVERFSSASSMPDEVWSWLEELQQATRLLLREYDTPARRGRPHDWPLEELLSRLYNQWWHITGKPPKRSYNPYTNNHYSPFYDFVHAVVGPLQGPKGLKRAARRILEAMSKTKDL